MLALTRVPVHRPIRSSCARPAPRPQGCARCVGVARRGAKDTGGLTFSRGEKGARVLAADGAAPLSARAVGGERLVSDDRGEGSEGEGCGRARGRV